jgi:hypothetical protein
MLCGLSFVPRTTHAATAMLQCEKVAFNLPLSPYLSVYENHCFDAALQGLEAPDKIWSLFS